MKISFQLLFITLIFIAFSQTISAQEQTNFEPLDVFQLEYAGDPQISPNGEKVVYRRMGFDIMNDKATGSLWILDSDGKNHHKLTSNDIDESQAAWSPTGDRILYVSSGPAGNEVYMYWVASGTTARLTQLPSNPGNIAWAPNGKTLAFTMKVDAKQPVLVKMPEKPKDAKWAESARITDRLKHEADGAGYIKPGFTHIFTLTADGGTALQRTSGNFNNGGSLSWSPDSQKIYFSGNRNENWEYEFRNSEIYVVNLAAGYTETITDRNGPDENPLASPDGKYIAYYGFEDKVQAYQVNKLQLMEANGGGKKILSTSLDRDIANAVWDKDSKGLYVKYDDKGRTKLAYIDLQGKVTDLVDNVGGTTLGRPYSSGSFSVSDGGKIAYTISYPDRPADIAILEKNKTAPKIITQLNEDLFAYKKMATIDEIWYKSSVDGRDIQGFFMYPPDFDKRNKYPLIVENHGGPILNYGAHFSAEMQLYAAAGYIVFYPNPRGSTSYGEEFGNLLFNNYPAEDYNDVMDGVDEMIKRKKIDTDRLYVTGGSAGGSMTAWIIGKNNRFKAAVVAKPVMNWISKTLTADNYYGYADSRYPGQPWENFENYWKFSPISLVGNIQTPTMVMVGMNDLRTPPSEAKQLYHALKLRKIETVLVEIPEAGHGIANRPSNLITKVAHTLAWFEKFK